MSKTIRMGLLFLGLGACLACLMPGAPVAQDAGPAAADSAGPAINVPYQDLKWTKVTPALGDKSAEMAMLRVDPVTKAAQFMVRAPKNFHLPKHWHTANVTHTVIQGTWIMSCDGKITTLKQGGWNFEPSKAVHESWSTPGQGALILVTSDGPFDTNWVGGTPLLSDYAPGRKEP
jgi:quercetin dioxygenase-like cupin family protein